MCAFERNVVLAGWIGLVPADAAAATDPGRLQLLAAEAARFTAVPGSSGPGGTSHAVLAALLFGTALAAFAGTYLGLRRFTVARVRDKDGWREVTYRFRSRGPMRLGEDTFRRLAGLLNELEELGARIRSARPEARKKVRPPAAPEPPARRVEFRRRSEPVPAPPPPEAVPVPGPVGPSAAHADRRSTYERARHLLREGHDPETVRELTGLQLAEVDLLRTVPARGGRT